MMQEPEYRKGRHVVSALHVHLVFVTKYRRAGLNAEDHVRLQTRSKALSSIIPTAEWPSCVVRTSA